MSVAVTRRLAATLTPSEGRPACGTDGLPCLGGPRGVRIRFPADAGDRVGVTAGALTRPRV